MRVLPRRRAVLSACPRGVRLQLRPDWHDDLAKDTDIMGDDLSQRPDLVASFGSHVFPVLHWCWKRTVCWLLRRTDWPWFEGSDASQQGASPRNDHHQRPDGEPRGDCWGDETPRTNISWNVVVGLMLKSRVTYATKWWQFCSWVACGGPYCAILVDLIACGRFDNTKKASMVGESVPTVRRSTPERRASARSHSKMRSVCSCRSTWSVTQTLGPCDLVACSGTAFPQYATVATLTVLASSSAMAQRVTQAPCVWSTWRPFIQTEMRRRFQFPIRTPYMDTRHV